MVVDERTRVLAEGLIDLLREHLGDPGLDFAADPVRLTGGFWAELLAFDVTPAPAGWDRRLVARVMPDPDTAAKEGAFQHEVAGQGYPTPIVRLQRGPEAGIDGRAVMVMDLAEGAPLLAGLDGAAAVVRFPSLARQLPGVLAEVLVQLHEIDPGPVARRLAASDAPRPDLDAMLDHLRASAEQLDRPALADVGTWLADHRPPTDSDVVCHGDLHPFNVLVGPDGHVTVLDWSAALIAPRGYDLGFTSTMLAEPPLVVPRPFRPVVRLAGRTLSRGFIRQYEARAGRRVDRDVLRWHQGLICLRALTDVARWSVDGSLPDRSSHPWVINEIAWIRRLRRLTGIAIPPEQR